MEKYPHVNVVELSMDETSGHVPEALLATEYDGIRGLLAQEAVSSLLANIHGEADRAYLLTWPGDSKIPRGAVVEGHEVAWTQNGVVTDSQDNLFATYARLQNTPDQRAMLVYPMGQRPDQQEQL